MIKALSVILSVAHAASMQASLQVSPSTVAAVSSLSITLKLDSLVGVPTKGGFRVTVPSSFGKQVQCDIVDPSSVSLVQDPLTGSRCQLLSANQVQMTISSGSLPAAATVFLQLTLFNNPGSLAANAGFAVSTFDAAGVLSSSIGSLSIATLIPNVLNASIKAMTDGIGLKSPDTALLVQFQTVINLPCSQTTQSCSLILMLPYLEPNEAVQQSSVIDQASLSCELSKNSSPFVSVPCSLIPDQASPSQVSLQVSALTNAIVTTANPLTLKVWGFKNPISLNPLTGFVLKTMEGTGAIEISSKMQVSVTQPGVIKNAQVTLESGSSQITGISNVRIDFYSPIPLSSGCTLQITVPADFANLRLSLTAVKVYGQFGFIKSIPYTVSDSVIQATGACQSYSENMVQSSIRLEGLQNPAIIKDTASFRLVIADVYGQALSVTQSQLVLASSSFTPGQFSIASISLTNPTVLEPSGMSFTVQPTNKLSQEGRIVVTIPPEFITNSNSTVVPVSLKNLDGSKIECISNSTSNKLLVRQLFYSFGYTPKVDGTISFNLTNIIAANPAQTLPGMSIKIQTYDLVAAATSQTKAIYGLVDETLIPTDGLVSPGTFKSANFTTDAVTVSTFPANATISLTLSHPVPLNSQVYLFLPKDFGVAQLQSTCTSAIGFITPLPLCIFKSQPDGSTIVIANGVKSLPTGSQVSFKLTSLRMPRYQGQLQGKITLATGTKDAVSLIDRISLDFFTPKPFDFEGFILQQGSQVTSAVNTLSLSIVKPLNLPLVPGDMMLATLPASFYSFTSTKPLCRLNNVAQNCTYDQQKKVLTVANIIDAQKFTFSAEGLLNSPSIKAPAAVSVTLVDSNYRLLASIPQSLAASSVLVVSQAASIDSLLVEQTSTKPEVVSDLSFTFKSASNMPDYLFIAIDLPPCMQTQSVSAALLGASATQLQSLLVGASRITVKLPLNTIKPDQGFVLRGLVNPSESCHLQGGIKISLFDDSALSNLMATGSVTLSLSCQDFCTACNPNQRDFCTSCKQGFSLIAEAGVCSTECPIGFINDQAKQECLKCSNNCSACSESVDFCTACSDNSFVTTENGTCISQTQCQSMTSKFANTNKHTCEDCLTPCIKCSNEGCLSCESKFFQYEGQCITTCPPGTLQKFSDSGNYCEAEPNELVAWKLISDIPLAYSTVVLFIIAAILKLTCFREISLLVTLVIMINFIETISLFELSILTVKDESTSKNLAGLEKGIFRFLPLGSLFSVLLLNVMVVVNHCQSLRPGKKASSESKKEYEDWVAERIAKRTLIYTISCTCSFHNINWFNFFGLFPDSLKRRMIRQEFIAFYTRFSKFSMIFPRMLLLAYCTFFGVFNALGKLDIESESSADMLACVVEHLFLSVTSIFLLFLALNFSWYDDPVEIIKQHELHKEAHAEDQATSQAPQKMYAPKSSFDLHMLKSSRFARPKPSKQVRAQADSISFGFEPSRTEVQLAELKETHAEQTSINVTGNELLEPEKVVKDSKDSELNFDFLEQMKQTIIKSRRQRPGRPENASDGKQAVRKSLNSSDRTIKTQRFQQKHLTVGLSPIPRKTARPLEQIEDVSNTSFTGESIELEMGGAFKNQLVEMSPSTVRTKVESLVRDFDQEVLPELPDKSNFDSPKSVDLSPPVAKLSKFVKN